VYFLISGALGEYLKGTIINKILSVAEYTFTRHRACFTEREDNNAAFLISLLFLICQTTIYLARLPPSSLPYDLQLFWWILKISDNENHSKIIKNLIVALMEVAKYIAKRNVRFMSIHDKVQHIMQIKKMQTILYRVYFLFVFILTVLEDHELQRNMYPT